MRGMYLVSISSPFQQLLLVNNPGLLTPASAWLVPLKLAGNYKGDYSIINGNIHATKISNYVLYLNWVAKSFNLDKEAKPVNSLTYPFVGCFILDSRGLVPGRLFY
ncbi:MAG: hypothetical protein IPN08_10425 [Bacteroidales bacterium]|nr:hypothetical protein [Bacteroidales bacterium]